ncbi:cytochrome P450, partial [Salmonella sp. s54925]|uniref:cytochrome P450 n=1 Tax=Salmonella sp. s54925 TaxID=3159674 RepID=UPI00398028E4
LNLSENYWQNPDHFHPDRFADGSREVPGSFFQFGMGPRKCLGYRHALAINRLTVASFLQKFTLELIDRSDNGTPYGIKTIGDAIFTPYTCPELILRNRHEKK